MRIIGVDPGYGRTGVAIFDHEGKGGIVHLELIETSPKITHERRLDQVYVGLRNLISEHEPKLLAIEKLFHGKNAKTVLGVAEARGVALLAGARMHLPVVEFSPNEVKLAVTGYGKSTKDDVSKMLALRLKAHTELWIDDVTDALAVAYTAWLQQPLHGRMKNQ